MVGIDQDGDPHYSNIDVMLVSDDGDIVLLLESKFTEYLSWGKQTGISDVVYGRYYDEIKPVLDEIGLTYSHQVDKEGCKVRGYMNLEAIKGATQVYAPLITTDKSLKVIDHYMQDCIRYIATDSWNKSRFDYRYDHMKEIGLITLVNKWYSYNVLPSEHSVR